MEFPLSYFKSWKMMLLKHCTQYASKFGKLSSGHRTGKGQFLFKSQEGQCQRMLKLLHTALISHASKEMLKILQAKLQQCMNRELPDIQTGFRKGRGTRDQISSICWIIKKARQFQENIYFCFIDYTKLKPLTVWITTNCGKYLKRWDYQATWPASWETCMQVKKQQLESDMEQQTGSKLGKEYVKAVYCHPAYLIYMQRTSCEMLGWLNHKLESRFQGELSITSDLQMTPPLW